MSSLSFCLALQLLALSSSLLAATAQCTEGNELYFPPELNQTSLQMFLDVTSESSVLGVLVIFPMNISTTQCSGTATAIEFCYQYTPSQNGMNLPVFTLYLFEEETATTFRLNKSIEFSAAPSAANVCDTFPPRCCERRSLGSDMFSVPSPNLFGVAASSSPRHTLLTFTLQQLSTEYYLHNVVEIIDDELGRGISTTGRGYRMVRFIIEPGGNSTVSISSVSANVSPSPTASEPSTSQQPETLVMSTDSVEMAASVSTMPVSVSSSVVAPSTEVTAEDRSQVPTIVGAVLGVLGGVILLLVLVVVALLCVVRSRKQNHEWVPPESDKTASEQQSFANATYGAADFNVKTDNDKIDVETCADTSASYHNNHRGRSVSSETGASKTSTETPHEYCLPDEIRGVRITESSNEYAYAETETRKPSLPSARKLTQSHEYTHASTAGSISKPRSSSKREVEEIYMAPARDENSLYAQFNDFRIKQVQRESIKTTDHLGSGQFGVVQKGVWQSNNIEVAVKTLQPDSSEADKVKFLQEAAIMGQFVHPNVVKLHGVVTVGEPVLIILELLPKGDLRNLLVNLRTLPGEKPDVHTLLSYCRQIASGMNYLSGKSFVHRDLAARNILVTEDDICKIADFGMSRDLMDETYYISHGGKIPVKWTAPEALNYRKYSAASDVWSFGAVMYEIWSLGHKPFEGYTNPQTMREVEEGFRLPPPPGCPRAVYELMIKCWHPTTSKRPTFTDVSQHLSLSDPKLLKWSAEDKAVHPEATTLGAQLEYTQELFFDLQKTYTSSDDYENTS